MDGLSPVSACFDWAQVEIELPVFFGEARQSKQIVDVAGGNDLQAPGAIAITLKISHWKCLRCI